MRTRKKSVVSKPATRKPVTRKPVDVKTPAAPQNENPGVVEDALPEGMLNKANGIPNPNLDRRND